LIAPTALRLQRIRSAISEIVMSVLDSKLRIRWSWSSVNIFPCLGIRSLRVIASFPTVLSFSSSRLPSLAGFEKRDQPVAW